MAGQIYQPQAHGSVSLRVLSGCLGQSPHSTPEGTKTQGDEMTWQRSQRESEPTPEPVNFSLGQKKENPGSVFFAGSQVF